MRSNDNTALQILTFCANRMALGVIELIFQVFEKKEVKTLRNSVFGHFWKIVELSTDVLKPSVLSEIGN